MSALNVGDRVRLISVPEWLLRDLPLTEQENIRSFVGQVTEITEIDAYGYAWVGFGLTENKGRENFYSGQSFAVSPDCLELLEA